MAFLVHLLVLILSTQLPLCLSKTDDLQCNKPFQCGNMENLTYPFRHPASPVHCGDPGFDLTCEPDNYPLITINSLSYQVLAFDILLRSLTVAPIDVSNNLLCPQQPVNISLDGTSFHSASNTRNLTLYHDCPADANRSLGLSNHQFDCTINGTHTVGYYVATSGFYKLSGEAKDALRSCRSSVLVPAFASTLQALEKTPSPANLVLTLSNGFGLRWKGNDSVSGSSDVLTSRIKLRIGLGVAGAAILAIIVMAITLGVKNELLSKRMLTKKFRKGKSKDWEMIEDFILQYGSEIAPKRYSYSEIKRITKSFKDELGQGGFGAVYKGTLPDGRLVAVKVLSESKARAEDFVNEVASISRTSHVNIVAFLGFCFEGSIRALIYEFMPNGSLDKFICRPTSPDKFHDLELKTTLYEIALGIGRGLEYLHQGCSTRILHFDIKPHNILLDENFCPKISDFGLAKLCERMDSIVSMISARGTVGYIAPEVFCRSFGGVSHKSDVYSYGMMILEMVGQRGNGHGQNSDTIFPIRIYELLKQGKDLGVEGMGVEREETSRKMIIVSLWCIQSNPMDRPSMTKVLEMLQGSIESLPIPPTPFLFSTQVIPEISSSSSSTLLSARSNYMDNSV